MEIATSPHRPAPTPWGRLLVLVIVLGPVTALALLPTGLGFERYVISRASMAGTIDRGSVVFERRVPVSDLRVGDVITYQPPRSAGIDEVVTHRIIEIDSDGIVTKGDALSRPDPWTLRPDQPTLPRVVFTLPWVGYAYLVADSAAWMLLIGSVGSLLLLLANHLARRPSSQSPVADDITHPALARSGSGSGPGSRRNTGGHER